MILHLQSVPPRNGLLWVRHGLKVLQRKPIALIGLFALFMLVSSVLQLVPLLGQLLVMSALPLVSLAFMLASHQVLQSHTPTAAVFAQPLQLTKERRRAQIGLGLLYTGSTVAVLFLAHWLDGGALARVMDQVSAAGAKGDARGIEAAMSDPALTTALGLRAALLGLLSVPFWHAPALIHWGGQGVLQALFSSTLGVWRNKGLRAVRAGLDGTEPGHQHDDLDARAAARRGHAAALRAGAGDDDPDDGVLLFAVLHLHRLLHVRRPARPAGDFRHPRLNDHRTAVQRAP